MARKPLIGFPIVERLKRAYAPFPLACVDVGRDDPSGMPGARVAGLP